MSVPKKVLDHFDVSSEDVSDLHSGENLSWKIKKGESTFVLKKLRSDRSKFFSGRSEMAWLVSINSEVRCVSPFCELNSLVEYEGHEYIAYKFINGSEPDHSALSVYSAAGRLLKRLHFIGAQKYKEHDQNREWLGYERPTYDFKYVIEDSIATALNSKLLSKESEKEIIDKIDLLRRNFPKDRTFIHGDYHLGNLIEDKGGLKIIDFDECGFGSIFYDLGTIRLHTMAAKNKEAWKAFLEGYGLNENSDALKFGVASRFIFMAGKIPTRLDVPGLSEKAGLIMDRYIRWFSDVIEND